MHVVATAGHVDHGKSSLVRALTGTDPDRLAEEKRRGLTIDLGFAVTRLDSGEEVAFVDVPGHERFVPTMLAGVGPVPVALLVVAADGGWMPQSAEHLAALDALGVRRALVVVTRADLADPTPAAAVARIEVAGTSLAADGPPEVVACSAATGAGLAEVRAALDRLLATVPAPRTEAPVRLWVDRSFSVRGAGTVVTGTLAAGTVSVGDVLDLADGHDGPPSGVRVRGVQSHDRSRPSVPALARVALNLRDVDRRRVSRGHALLTPGWFRPTREVDAELPDDGPEHVVVHLGSAAVPARVRRFPGRGRTGRLRLERALPLRVGDRLLLRDPTRHEILGAALVLDVEPPRLERRRGAAARRAEELAGGPPDAAEEVRRRGAVRGDRLREMGIAVDAPPSVGDWHVHPDQVRRWREALEAAVAAARTRNPLLPGPATGEVVRALDLPDPLLLTVVVADPWEIRDGRVQRSGAGTDLPPALVRAAAALKRELAADEFAAPTAERLRELGIGPAEQAALDRAGALRRLGDGVLLGPDCLPRAAARLAALPQPFSVSEARQALGSSRRVVLPLLGALDGSGATRRGPDDRRTVVGAAGGPALRP
ncbi:selenocysteine-specific translation elongation factor [Kineococcus gynurae]|uniref:Selenocysteine-specific translation elongation factor n=1 Tax=Kineococcus gynurae TaxID=452979 RepID=A0ABV5LXK8_9ACTN